MDKPLSVEWKVSSDGKRLLSDDFTNDVRLEIRGDFQDDGDRAAYGQRLANKLNASFTLPKEPPPGLLVSMAMRYRHDFGLNAMDDHGPIAVGVSPSEREYILNLMRKYYEEVSGHGFYQWP